MDYSAEAEPLAFERSIVFSDTAAHFKLFISRCITLTSIGPAVGRPTS